MALGHRDGFTIDDVASASGAVPGLSPVVQLKEMLGLDGGMASSTNVSLARGHDGGLVVRRLCVVAVRQQRRNPMTGDRLDSIAWVGNDGSFARAAACAQLNSGSSLGPGRG